MTDLTYLSNLNLDNERINFYFAPFRESRTINANSWDNKLNFWQNLIQEYCKKNKMCVFNSSNLPDKFVREGRVPNCLDTVIQEMLRNGSIRKLSDFISSTNSSWISWSFDWLVKKPIGWSYNNVFKNTLSWFYKNIIGNDNDADQGYLLRLPNKHVILPDEDYVLLPLLKEFSNTIINKHNESVTYQVTDNVIDYHLLCKQCRDICGDSVKSFDVAILELCRQNLCKVTFNAEGEKLIIMQPNEKNLKKLPLGLTGNEIQIHKLTTLEKKIESDITKIENEIVKCRENAKILISQGKKSLAMKSLKRKKTLETILKQKEIANDKINSIISAIQQTESQKQIFDAYSSGVEAFKGLCDRSGLNVDKIDETILDIQEAFQVNEEINHMISQPIISDQYDVNQEDLDAELEKILESDQGDMDTSNLSDILDLPSVPSGDPFNSPIQRKITSPMKT